MNDPQSVALQALEREWGRGSPSSQRERYARAVIDALADADFLKNDSRSENPARKRGRPPVIPLETRELIRQMYAGGAKFNEIARWLNQEGVPAATGRWHHSSVSRIARGEAAQER